MFKWDKRLALLKGKGGKRYLHRSWVIFHAVLHLSPIVSEGQRQLLHCLMVSYVLPSITDYWAELLHSQLAGWARYPTAEEHLHLLLERGSLNSEFQVWNNLLKQTGKRNFMCFLLFALILVNCQIRLGIQKGTLLAKRVSLKILSSKATSPLVK